MLSDNIEQFSEAQTIINCHQVNIFMSSEFQMWNGLRWIGIDNWFRTNTIAHHFVNFTFRCAIVTGTQSSQHLDHMWVIICFNSCWKYKIIFMRLKIFQNYWIYRKMNSIQMKLTKKWPNTWHTFRPSRILFNYVRNVANVHRIVVFITRNRFLSNDIDCIDRFIGNVNFGQVHNCH